MPRQSQVISVVDDSRSMREALDSLLRSYGYEVRGFASAEDFLDAGAPDSWGLLISDVRLPGMSGLELQRHLAQTGVGLPTVLMAGHDCDDGTFAARALRDGAVAFLHKPFEHTLLLAAIQQAWR
jgi:two-component system response regulator FixJ